MATRKKATKKRRTIGADPLDAVVGGASLAVKASRRGLAPAGTAPKPKPPARKREAKVRATFHLPEGLLEEARDAVVHLSGPPARLTLATLAEAALRKELERLKKAHNGGRSFPKREGELKGGRPIGS